jgi:hypothetical protein
MGAIKYLSLFTTLSVFTALFAIIFQSYTQSNDLQRKTNILKKLLQLENYHYYNDLDKPVNYASFIMSTSFATKIRWWYMNN